ncbi:adiponectin receptor protein 2 [Alexandromys fortis]|uniref:adiponectin receptor protein 2 n=1 Tax=Alexandromys fortis TaxID=100897 RepID=UPI0021521FA5|nr:adiponectin receptor protein 2 [Microtus fortis]
MRILGLIQAHPGLVALTWKHPRPRRPIPLPISTGNVEEAGQRRGGFRFRPARLRTGCGLTGSTRLVRCASRRRAGAGAGRRGGGGGGGASTVPTRYRGGGSGGGGSSERPPPSAPPLPSPRRCFSRRRSRATRRRPTRSSEEPECKDDNSQEDEGFMGMSPLLQAHHAMERMEEFVCKVWEGRWRVIPHDVLPDWLKDNDFLLHGHRPPMPSFRACFKSIFRIHTETGNIWTHLLGCVFFLCLGIFYMFRPNISFVAPLQEKVVFGLFFLGAILCLSFSWLFHTVYCHSEGVSRLFSKLDYSGIALLIMGSFVPWLYYSFYCNPQPCFIYLIVICVLGIAAIIVSQWDMFATPQYRGVRAGVFVGLGLSGIIPTLHYVISEGFLKAATIGQIGWLLLMASLYITGAALYAARIPERFFPGKCDIWFHSHQLFHIFVVAGAFVHFHGVSNLQEFRFMIGGGCTEEDAL